MFEQLLVNGPRDNYNILSIIVTVCHLTFIWLTELFGSPKVIWPVKMYFHSLFTFKNIADMCCLNDK